MHNFHHAILFQVSVYNSSWMDITSDYVQVPSGISTGAFVDVKVYKYTSRILISLKASNAANRISLNEVEVFVGDTHYNNRYGH